MKYCEKCELHFEDELENCPNCGEVLETEEDSTIPFTVVAFLIPIVGLIMFLASFKSHPKRAKFIALGALIGIVIQGIFGYILGSSVDVYAIAVAVYEAVYAFLMSIVMIISELAGSF